MKIEFASKVLLCELFLIVNYLFCTGNCLLFFYIVFFSILLRLFFPTISVPSANNDASVHFRLKPILGFCIMYTFFGM